MSIQRRTLTARQCVFLPPGLVLLLTSAALSQPANDTCPNAVLVGVPSVTAGTTLGATPDGAPLCNGVPDAVPGVWYDVIGTGRLIIAQTCGAANFDTRISVYCGTCTNLVCVTADDNGCPAPTTQSSARWCSQGGVRYHILVHGGNPPQGNFQLSVSDGGPCTPQPLCPAVCGPRSDGLGCLQVTCTGTAQQCVPTKIRRFADGTVRVIACDCLPSGACHVDLVGGTITCVGQCPTGFTCSVTTTTNADGSVDFMCMCQPLTCGPDATGQHCNPTPCPNPGEACVPITIRRDINGNLRVIECACQPDTLCHVDFTSSGGVTCVGQCPTGYACHLTTTTNADGSIDYRCRCDPVTCGPDPTAQRCNPAPCPIAGQQCVPIRVRFNPANGQVTVLECDCRGPNDCHVEITTGTTPHCVGSCPAGYFCERTIVNNPDGTIDFKCDCAPIPCAPNATGQACNSTVCPNPNDQCVPIKIRRYPTGVLRVIQCDCLPPNTCHVTITAANTVACVGQCPTGFTCNLTSTSNTDGTVDYMCVCQPPQCMPDTTLQRCTPTQCPNANEQCVPTKIRRLPTGQLQVVTCDCIPIGRCHVDIVNNQVQCVGQCPPGYTCTLTPTPGPNGSTDFMCICQPLQCEPDPTGQGCNPVQCPVAGQQCVPIRVRFNPATGQVRVLECGCRGPNDCHVSITPGAFPQCVGVCPPNYFCDRSIVTNADGSIDIKCDCSPIPCTPDTTGQHCTPTQCPNANEQCVPTKIRRLPNGGGYIVLLCDCLPVGTCHVDFNAAGQVTCVGQCPAGYTCNLNRTTNADGSVDYMCICEPLTCGPDSTGTRCNPVACPIAGQQCLPIRVRYNPANGQITVLECDCRGPNDCHVDITSGTVPQCVGVCPAGQFCERSIVNNPDGTIEFKCDCSPIPCSPDATGQACNTTPCPVATQQCVPTKIRRTATGGLIVVSCDCIPQGSCHVAIVGGQVTCVGQCPAGYSCNLFSAVNPDGTTDYMCICQPPQQCAPDASGLRCSTTPCPTPSERCVPTKIRRLPNGSFQVIQCDCRPIGYCHVDFDAANGVTCVGTCPDGSACNLTVTTNTDGSVDYMCTCTPAVCGPDPNGARCLPVQCPVAGEQCLPIRVRYNPLTGQVTVLECDCRSPNECHVDTTPGGLPQCVGSCPSGYFCARTITNNADGTIEIKCDCSPIPCSPSPGGQGCNTTICPNANEQCVPTKIRRTASGGLFVIQCDCLPQGSCHVAITGTTVTCVGQCPTGYTCNLVTVTNPDGTIDYMCRCDPLPCGPDTTGQRCNPSPCPIAGQQCVPIHVRYNPATGQTVVLECDCRGPNDCHVQIAVGAVPQCVGVCPPGYTCRQTVLTNPDGTLDIRCNCGPDDCSPAPGGQTCNPTVCPNPKESCVPVKIRRLVTGGLIVIQCDCLPPGACHVDFGGPTGVTCVGSCPDGEICQLTTTPNADGSIDYMCRCMPVNCGPDTSGQHCNPVACPLPGQQCVPTRVRFNPANGQVTILACDCRRPNECHVEVVPGTVPFCQGACPNGQACRTNVVTNPDQTIEISCGCECICPGDMNGDGSIDGVDIQSFVDCLVFNVPSMCLCADIDQDGTIDITDVKMFVLMLLFGDGVCPPRLDLRPTNNGGPACQYRILATNGVPCPAGWGPGTVQCVECTASTPTGGVCPGGLVIFRFPGGCTSVAQRTSATCTATCTGAHVASFTP